MKHIIITVFLFLTNMLPVLGLASELHFFSGAGFRQPVDMLVEDFQKKTRHSIVVDYDGGGRLLARITASGQGDLFMPGAFFYIEKLQSTGKIHSWKPLVAHTPVIAVNKEKSDKVTGFEDLSRPGVRLAMGDPKAMAFGKTAMKILERSDLKDRILANIVVYGATVKQLAFYVAEGNVDASIIGRSDAFQYRDRLDIIPIPDPYFEAEIVAVAVLTTTSDLKAATALRDFLASPGAIRIFENFGFLPLKK
ncbi:MAG: molybdate ABC transporter substrate-binding protein [Deltaproteobacteria bacterium]|nr:molybdate ABC transporter substrate-binding protein [Deltaproteobacteria bacterium]